MATVAFFGSGGDGSMIPLDAVAKAQQVIALVRPVRPRSWLRRIVRSALSQFEVGTQGAMTRWAKLHNVSLIDAVSGNDPEAISRLTVLAPDVICVSAFPWVLGREMLQTAHHARLNVHPSLLPRHRGPNPLLWLYYHNDLCTGVTIHIMNERADAGDILAQQSFDLPRGFPVDRLYYKNALCGSQLLVQVLGELEGGRAKHEVQDERSATYAPRMARGTAMVKFQEWDVERVWHFLAGLCPRRREPLQEVSGRKVRYESVLGYTPGDCLRLAGTVQRASFGWNLYCRDGSVQLANAQHGKGEAHGED